MSAQVAPRMLVFRCQNNERGNLPDVGRNVQDRIAFEFSGGTQNRLALSLMNRGSSA